MRQIEADLVEAVEFPRKIQDGTFWIKAAILGLLIGYLYYRILFGLAINWWTDPNFSHGFLIPIFSGLVVWQKRKQLKALKPKPAVFGLAVIAGSLVILILGVLGAEFFLSRSSFVFLLAGLLIYFLGWSYFRVLLFPWAFLFFMIPIPVIIFNQIAFPLQFLAAHMASSLLSSIGVPVLREGNIIQLPTMTLEVAEACSGIRSLMSLGALAVIFGYLVESRSLPRIILALASIPIAVAANGLRIMGTGLLGNYWDPDKAQGFFHEFQGWVIFVISLVMLFAVQVVMRWFSSVGSTQKGNKP
ncbi:MAG TPA: exosortase A [Terriglobia bacterium]|nr:exosortase A [Terriglobia bacterium]